MTVPVPLRVNPDLLRDLGSAWHTLADSMGSLDPGGAVALGADSVGGSLTAEAMKSAGVPLNSGVVRTIARFRTMAECARHTADSAQAADDAFAATLRRIDGDR